MSEVEEDFNYGKLFNFFLNGNWSKHKGSEYKAGLGMCWCLSTAVSQFYREEEALATRMKLLEKIKEMFPDRTSKFATRIAQVKEPMITEQYSLTGFNDHPDTDIDDVLLLCKECRV